MFMNQQGGGGGGGRGGNPFGGGMDDFGGGGFGGMPGGGRPPQQKPKPDDINRPLPVSLEDLFNGATKKLKVTRRLLSGEEQEKIVTVSIKPGWKAGTKVRYDGLGTEIRGGPSADIVCELFLFPLVNPASLTTSLLFTSATPVVIEEKPHPIYKRADSDLIATLDMPLVEALTGTQPRTLKLLDGTTLNVPVPSAPVQPGKETRLPDQGMPISKAGSRKRRGDLIIKWNVVLPTGLTPTQKEELKRILA